MSAAQNCSGRFYLTRRVLVSILILAIVVTSVFVYVYYSLSVTSVAGVTIQQVLADRKILNPAYPNGNAVFLFEVRVWSTTQYLTVVVEKPSIVADLSGVHIGNQTLDSGTIYPGSSIVYNVRFAVNASSIGYERFAYSGDSVTLGMAARLTSGFYSQPETICDGKNWNWTTASITSNLGSHSNCSI